MDPNQQIGDVQELDVDARSITQIEVPPWSESYELSSTDVDGEQIHSHFFVLHSTCLKIILARKLWTTSIDVSGMNLSQEMSSML